MVGIKQFFIGFISLPICDLRDALLMPMLGCDERFAGNPPHARVRRGQVRVYRREQCRRRLLVCGEPLHPGHVQYSALFLFLWLRLGAYENLIKRADLFEF